jgi:hypothetical protein
MKAEKGCVKRLLSPLSTHPAGIFDLKTYRWILPAAAFMTACSQIPATTNPSPITTAAITEDTPGSTFTKTGSAPAFAPVYTPGAARCEIITDGEVSIYQRPSIASGLFGTLPAGDREQASAYTADGWIGFDPGVAQAANVGVFRNRWLEWGEAFHLEGACESLPLVAGPPPGICFLMISEDTPAYGLADASSIVVITLHIGDYAEAIGRATDWFKVNLGVGSVQINQEGWIAAALANLNGPCDDLPVLGP